MDIVILMIISALYINSVYSISTHHVRAVSPRDYFQHGPLPPDKTNWEVGLKEATYQALIREQIPDPRLKEGIYDSDIEGFQNSATPFGDIAVIARGQLYATNQGYQFVQDPYQNDCDDCHTPHRCDRRQCEPQIYPNLDNLIALWTVKRVRHRDPKFGHRFELQYTISPMGPAARPEFVARNGRFDYNLPGHVFIVKLKENGEQIHNNKNNFRFDKEHKGTNHKEFKIVPWSHNINTELYNIKTQTEKHYQHTPNSVFINAEDYYIPTKENPTTEHVFNPGFLIGISPNGYKHIIHDIPSLVAERPYIDDKQYYRPQEQSTKEPIKHLHHHFYIPEVTDIDYDKKVVPTIITSTTTKDQQHITNYKPITRNNNNLHKFIVTTNNIPETTSPKQVYTQESTRTQVGPPLTSQGVTYRTTYKYPETTIPITVNPALYEDVRYTTNTEPSYINTNYPRTTVLKVYTVPSMNPTTPTPFNPSPFFIQYSEPDPIYSNQPPTIPTYIPQTINPTIHPTVPTYVTIQEHPKTASLVDIYDELGNTQATTPIPRTTQKPQTYPDSINAQLPPPEKGTDTTVPYVASTAVTILSTGSPTESIIQEEQSDEKSSESSERKATTIQENIYSTTTSPYYNDETISVEYSTATEPTYSTNTTSYEETTTTTTELIEKNTTTKRKQDGDLFGPISKKNSKTKNVQEEFDIFGESKNTSEQVTKPITAPTKSRPNAFDDIFSEFKSSTENSNKFLTAYTQLSLNRTEALKNARISKYLKYRRNKTNLNKFGMNRFSSTTEKQNIENSTQQSENRTDNIETKTSFITSISFKVNKNTGNKTDNSLQESTPSNDTSKIEEISNKKIKYETTTTDRTPTFDDIAQTLVNHARIATYLNTKPTRRTHKPNNKKR